MNEITQIEYAIRYCITRDSYAFDDGVQLAEKHWDHLSESTQGDVLESVRQRSHDISRCPLITAGMAASDAVHSRPTKPFEVAVPSGWRMGGHGDPVAVFRPDWGLVLVCRPDGSVAWKDRP